MNLPRDPWRRATAGPEPTAWLRDEYDCSAVRPERGREGFSVVELLVVVVLLLVLTTLLWSPRAGSRETSRQAACRSQLERIGIAMQLYASEHAGAFPRTNLARVSAEALSLLVPRYISDVNAFSCPGKPRPLKAGQPLAGQRFSYAYYMGLHGVEPARAILTDEQINPNAKSAGQLLFSPDGKPPANNHGPSGGNLLFTDGHVEKSPAKAVVPLDLGPGVVLLNP